MGMKSAIPFIVDFAPPERLAASQGGVDAELCKRHRQLPPTRNALQAHGSEKCRREDGESELMKPDDLY